MYIKIKNLNKYFRISEYKVLFYRLGLVYLFYLIARLLFLFFNNDVTQVTSITQFFKLYYHGLAFDTTAILYVNSLFILLSIFPFWLNTHKTYQKTLFYIYFVTNLIAYATNFIDFIYYKYTFSRTTIAAWELVKNEESKSGMFFRFLITYWYVFLLFFICAFLWIYTYKKIQPISTKIKVVPYLITSVFGVLIIATLAVGGIRGDFKKSTRPINLVDANRYVTKMEHADVVLNTPFALIRTFNKKTFVKVPYQLNNDEVKKIVKPIKQYTNTPSTRPNIVLIITESLGREYLASFNKNSGIDNFIGYTPFLDSLASSSLIFTRAYANGYKSIHGMSSVVAGIPSFKDAFTSSPYSKQKITSLVSILNEEGYDTSFFHGAPNGSMGFLGFGNILGFDNYYGKTEFNNDKEFDGSWGIWDEPFLDYTKKILDTKEKPFFATIFTISSHEPYVIPEKYEGKFPKGNSPMHQCIGYTDYAFKKFFEAAKKETWFNNTIFVITADHCNLSYYTNHYSGTIINRYAVPILFYTPSEKYKGENNNWAQQIDIYPTLLDMIGYKKPFRSWGRSLIDTTHNEKPFVFNYNNKHYQFAQGNYICIFDGKKAIGFYNANDLKLEKNLINNRNNEMNNLEKICKAYLKDYFDRIIDKKLTTQP